MKPDWSKEFFFLLLAQSVSLDPCVNTMNVLFDLGSCQPAKKNKSRFARKGFFFALSPLTAVLSSWSSSKT